MRTCVKLLPLLAVLTVAAWAQKVQYDFDRSANFQAYRTYSWMPQATTVDQLTDQSIRSAIDRELADKGLVRVDQNPDLLVGYQLTVREQQEIQTWGDAGWGWRSPGWATTTVTEVPVGSLVVDLYDPARQQLVFRTVGTKTLDTNASPEKREKNLDKALDKMFKHYPPERND